jgi:hypothetical protein
VLGIDSDRHLVVDSGPEGPNWDCLGAPPPILPASATLYFVLGDPSTEVNCSQPQGTPIPGVAVTACTRLDADCSSPFAKSPPTDATGRTSLVVPGGFDGYFQAPANGTFLPAIYAHEPIQGTQVFDQSMMRTSLVSLAAKITGVQLDPSAGTVIPYVLDCHSQSAAGVTFDAGMLGPSERVFYLSQCIPSVSATETDSTGGGFILNVPAGSITIQATNSAGQLVASNTTFVRAGYTTFVQLRPNQATYNMGP